MFLNSWSLALLLCSLVVLFLLGIACRSAVRVLRYWDPAGDDNRQILLENEIWLTSTLVEYGLGVQIVTLVVFVLAADHFCHSIVGAMCATGALLANDFGVPSLIIKIVGVFLYGFWIVLHQLDIRSEQYPLVRMKYVYLLLLLPLVVVDVVLEILYIAGLKPDIITSCCAVVFSDAAGGGPNLFTGFSHPLGMGLFYGALLALLATGLLLLRRWRSWLGVVYSGGWLVFLILALMVITTEISSYIYAMPYHKCPFCILKPQYHYIGFAIYGTLIPAAFFGISAALVEPLRSTASLEEHVPRYQKAAVRFSLILMGLFAVFSSYHYLKYMFFGGEG